MVDLFKSARSQMQDAAPAGSIDAETGEMSAEGHLCSQHVGLWGFGGVLCYAPSRSRVCSCQQGHLRQLIAA